MKLIKCALGLLSVLALASCQSSRSGTSTGTPFVSFALNGSTQSATVALLIKHSPIYGIFFPSALAASPASVTDSRGVTITLNQFWATTGSVEFKAEESKSMSEVDGAETSFEGPFTVDLLQSNVAILGASNIPTSTIRRIKIRLRRTAALPATAPAGLSGKSIYVSGSVSGNTFVFVTQDEPTLEISGSKALVASNGDSLLLQIQTANFFKQIDLSLITMSTSISESNRIPTSGSACPHVNASSADLYTCFHDGFNAAANLGRDKGDHELMPSDSTLK